MRLILNTAKQQINAGLVVVCILPGIVFSGSVSEEMSIRSGGDSYTLIKYNMLPARLRRWTMGVTPETYGERETGGTCLVYLRS